MTGAAAEQSMPGAEDRGTVQTATIAGVGCPAKGRTGWRLTASAAAIVNSNSGTINEVSPELAGAAWRRFPAAELAEIPN
jgi:hypothetical protein